MPVELYASFVAASVALILVPGPMVALIVANGATRGVRSGLVTMAGAATAMIVHLVAVCLGLAALLSGLGEAAFWLKWVGAVYLLFLGVSALTAKAPVFAEIAASSKTTLRMYLEAFLVQLTNPKLLVFYAAFFPMFIPQGIPVVAPLLMMSLTFLAIAVALDSVWALVAASARPLLRSSGRWGNRIAGGVLVAAALGTAMLHL